MKVNAEIVRVDFITNARTISGVRLATCAFCCELAHNWYEYAHHHIRRMAFKPGFGRAQLQNMHGQGPRHSDCPQLFIFEPEGVRDFSPVSRFEPHSPLFLVYCTYSRISIQITNCTLRLYSWKIGTTLLAIWQDVLSLYWGLRSSIWMHLLSILWEYFNEFLCIELIPNVKFLNILICS